MKWKPLKHQGLFKILLVLATYTIYVCLLPTSEASGLRNANSRAEQNYKNYGSVPTASQESSLLGETSTRQNIVVEVDQTVYIYCTSNRTTASGCEWFKRGPQGGIKKRITEFVGRYQKIQPCQLQIRNVTYEDEGTIICKTKTDSSGPSFHESQLTVTGQDDPFGNILVDRPTVPYASPEITIESIQEGKLERMQGDSIHLRCEGTGNPKPLVSWRRGSKTYATLTEGYSYLQLINLTSDDSGPYHCEAVNLFGKVVKPIRLDVKGPLRGAAEIIDVTPRNITLYEGNKGNITCIARFDDTPWFSWVKKIDHKPADGSQFSYEGQSYSVQPKTEIRSLGQHLYATTLLLDNVTLGTSGVYHCLVAGNHGYNHSEAYVVVEKDPTYLHIAVMRKHKTVTILWIFSFLIFAGLVILCFFRIYGCSHAASNKILRSQSSIPSESSASRKTQLPKRSPETLSTDCTNSPNEAFTPLMTHASCSTACPESLCRNYTSSSDHRSYAPSFVGTFNSYDPECSLEEAANRSVADSALSNLEAARSSFSHHKIEPYHMGLCSSPRSDASPGTQTSDYFTTRQLKVNGYHRSPCSHPNQHHNHQHHHHMYPVGSENHSCSHHQHPKTHCHQCQNLNRVCSCTQEYCPCYSPAFEEDFRQSSSNFSVSTDYDSQWYSESNKSPYPSHYRHRHNSVDEGHSHSYSLEEYDLRCNSRLTTDRNQLHPSPELSFLGQV